MASRGFSQFLLQLMIVFVLENKIIFADSY